MAAAVAAAGPVLQALCSRVPSVAAGQHRCALQEVEYVKEEAKLEYLLACLQKTAPPTLIFAESKSDVDLVHEHLLLHGVEAVSVHGGKDQEDRVHAIDSFKVCVPCSGCAASFL